MLLQIASMVGRLFAALDRWPTPLTLVEPVPSFFTALASGVKYRGLAWLLRSAKNPCAGLHDARVAVCVLRSSLLPRHIGNKTGVSL